MLFFFFFCEDRDRILSLLFCQLAFFFVKLMLNRSLFFMYLTYCVMINQVIGKFDKVTDFHRFVLISFCFF